MTLLEQLQDDLKTAMRGGDKQRVGVIRMLLAAIKNVQIAQVKEAFDAAVEASGGPNSEASQNIQLDRAAPLSETAVQETLTREVKRRRDAAEIYRKAGRIELAEQEEAEAAIIEGYLPRQLTAEELRPLIAAALADIGASTIADMGKAMPVLMQQLKGHADGRLISQVTREILSQPH